MSGDPLFDTKWKTGGVSIADRIDASGDCWEWTGKAAKTGYGIVSHNDKQQLVHRFVWEQLVGEIPDGLQIDHLCRNRLCCNPDHLEPVTSLENSRRGQSWSHNTSKTHCPKGHPYSGRNLITRTDRGNGRECQTCANARSRDYYRRIGSAKRKAERDARP